MENQNVKRKNKLEKVEPRSKRGFTDILCLVLSLLFFKILLDIAIIGLFQGDPNKLAVPHDPDHRACGKGEAKDFPYIYFATPLKRGNTSYFYRTTCVKECPKNITIEPWNKHLNCLPNSQVKSCAFKPWPLEQSVFYYDALKYKENICLPKATRYILNIGDVSSAKLLNNWVKDMKKSRTMIFFATLSAIIFCMIFIYFSSKKIYANSIMITLITMYFTLMILAIIVFMIEGTRSKDNYKKKQKFQTSKSLLDQANEKNDSKNFYLIFAVVLLVIFISTLGLFATYLRRKNIFKQAIQIFKYASQIIVKEKFILIWPQFLAFVLIVCYCIYVFFVCVYLFASGKIIEKEKLLPFSQFHTPLGFKIFAGIHIAGLLWVAYFIYSLANYATDNCFFMYLTERELNYQESEDAKRKYDFPENRDQIKAKREDLSTKEVIRELKASFRFKDPQTTFIQYVGKVAGSKPDRQTLHEGEGKWEVSMRDYMTGSVPKSLIKHIGSMAAFSFCSVFFILPLFFLNSLFVFFKSRNKGCLSNFAKKIEKYYERLKYGISYGKASKVARSIKEKCLEQQYEYASVDFEKEETLMNFISLLSIIGTLSFTITNSAIYLIILKTSDSYKKELSSPLLPYMFICVISFLMGTLALNMFSNIIEIMYTFYLLQVYSLKTGMFDESEHVEISNLKSQEEPIIIPFHNLNKEHTISKFESPIDYPLIYTEKNKSKFSKFKLKSKNYVEKMHDLDLEFDMDFTNNQQRTSIITPSYSLRNIPKSNSIYRKAGDRFVEESNEIDGIKIYNDKDFALNNMSIPQKEAITVERSNEIVKNIHNKQAGILNLDLESTIGQLQNKKYFVNEPINKDMPRLKEVKLSSRRMISEYKSDQEYEITTFKKFSPGDGTTLDSQNGMTIVQIEKKVEKEAEVEDMEDEQLNDRMKALDLRNNAEVEYQNASIPIYSNANELENNNSKAKEIGKKDVNENGLNSTIKKTPINLDDSVSNSRGEWVKKEEKKTPKATNKSNIEPRGILNPKGSPKKNKSTKNVGWQEGESLYFQNK